jgi:hypothetical protein
MRRPVLAASHRGAGACLAAGRTSPAAAEDLVDGALAEALAPVLRDLEGSGSVVPDVRDGQWPGVDGQVTAMLYSADNFWQGVSAVITEAPGAADRVGGRCGPGAGCRGAVRHRPAGDLARVRAASRFPSPVSGSAGEPPCLGMFRDRPYCERDRAAARSTVIAPGRPWRAQRDGSALAGRPRSGSGRAGWPGGVVSSRAR